MYVRLTFDGGQKLTGKEIEELSHDISDKVECDQLCAGEDVSPTSFSSWSYTLNPEDVNIEGNKKKLVKMVDLYQLASHKEYIVDLDLFLQKHPEIKVSFRGMPKTIEKDYSSIIQQIIAIQDKFENALKSFDQQVEFNQKCDVHISNLGLLHINQVGYAVDYCTEALQDLLNKGWRIIACCVQPDGRRPDYVLGKYNPDSEKLECVKF